jgi:hypothetical protein
MLIILEIDPSSLGTVDDTARMPFSVVNSGSPGLAPSGLSGLSGLVSPNSPNRGGLDSLSLALILLVSLLVLLLLFYVLLSI